MPPNGVNARSVSCNKTFCPPNIRVLSDSIRPVYAACDVSTSEFRFNMVLNGITLRGSIVGTRLDLKESLEFAAAGKVRAIVKAEPLENINDIFDRMRKGAIEGRIVVDYAMEKRSRPVLDVPEEVLQPA